ncbi:MAG: hypothetical protein JRH20_31110, partial [Deltaproteobacteria bacterium]|nr:hypothetical protein [Deltaproteobacteria bacterium]
MRRMHECCRGLALLLVGAGCLLGGAESLAGARSGTLDTLVDDFASKVQAKLLHVMRAKAPGAYRTDLVVVVQLGSGASESLRGVVERLLLSRIQRLELVRSG